ncbi:hypothetical protein G6F37_004675 [Rhizopus arrhizus]|nr:hypothetical protein G6F38_004926 [Rhizopus arrhizus]KAG1159681.1 hypothetical protein G6F37_004675 [Rhizopus arrhizus]
MTPTDYFYIRSVSTGNVVCSVKDQDPLRSQVMVAPPTLSDSELWYWKDQFIFNKANDLVLDIRKGRLRLIEDTEICLYHPKPLEEAHNQLWGIRSDAVDAYGKRMEGSYIYSLASNEWVLDIQVAENNSQKLVLFPLQPIDNDNQRWLIVPEGKLELTKNSETSYFSLEQDTINTPPPSTTPSPTYPFSSTDVNQFPQGLTPAKRGSHSAIFSIEAFKDYHNRVYGSQEANISDKGIAMATAYHIFQNWKLDQIAHDFISISGDVRSRLQLLTQKEVSKLLSNSALYSNNHKENTISLSSRLIIQLYDQTPISP